ncbi:MAG: hypothetical protein E7300_09600 [Lachnospiraceae bacterium]|nr:hypothetical protein [Lachnospiraceae bacterium]
MFTLEENRTDRFDSDTQFHSAKAETDANSTHLIVKGILKALALLVIAVTLGITFWHNLQGANLWHDEAMLAYSICNRSLPELLTQPLAYNQSAPILYIVIVKLFATVFGTSEFILRLPSWLSFAALLAVYYMMAKRICNHKAPLLETAALSCIPILISYSCEFKQYTTEAFAVLLVFLLYGLYRAGKFSWPVMILSGGLCILLGNPVCFLLGGILTYHFLEGILLAEKRVQIRQSIYGGMIVLAIFAAYYFYWLRPVIMDGYMVDFWTDFKLVCGDRKEILHSLVLIRDILNKLGPLWIVVTAGALAAVLMAAFMKTQKCMVVMVTLLCAIITAAASLMGRFPLKDRMFVFAYPLLLLLCFEILNRLWEKVAAAGVVTIIFAIAFMISNCGFVSYLTPESFIFSREEIRTQVEFLRDHIEADEKCYVYYDALPAFWYENGYDNDSIGQYQHNLIWGKGFFHNGDNQADIDLVKSLDKVYILICHRNSSGDRYSELLLQLQESGSLGLVMENYDTPIYYYTKVESDQKYEQAELEWTRGKES